MLDLYLRQYILDKIDVSQADPDNPAEIGQYLDGFMKEYGLSDGDVAAIRSGDPERIVPLFLHFDDAGAMEANLKAYQADNGLSDHEMEGLWKSGKILQILPDYIHSDPGFYNRFVRLTVESLLRFVSGNLVLYKARPLRSYDFSCMAGQELRGAHHIFLGIAGKEADLAAVAGKYTGRTFQGMDNLAYDSLCELINCINGLYASELSMEHIALEIAPPCHYVERTLGTNGLIHCLPAVIDGTGVDILFSFDSDVRVE